MKSCIYGCILLFMLGSLTVSQSQTPTPASSVESTDGVKIHYQEFGSGSPALVFVHGWSCDQSYWQAQIPYFSQRHKVVTLDLAGHGKSGQDRQDWTVTAFGEDVAAVVDKLDLEQVILIGHSMGGPVMVETAQLIPDRIIGLVGVETFKNLHHTSSPEEADNFLQPFVNDFISTTQAFVKTSMFTANSDSSLIAQIASDMSAASPEVAIASGRNLFLWNAREALAKIAQPIKVINADFQRTDMEAAQRHNIEVELMSGVGHFLMMEDSETFNSLLDKAIRTLATQRSK